MVSMRKYLAVAVVIVTSSVACSSEWTRTKYTIYPAMNEHVADLRVVFNWSNDPISAGSEPFSKSVRSYCSGSSSNLPPWSTYFASLFDVNVEWTGSTWGTVDPMKKRVWELWCINTGGEERWFKADENPNSHERLRIDRGDCFIVSYQLSLTGQGGSGE